MKTRTILKKLAVLIIFIFIANIQAQPNPCGCPSERETLDEIDKYYLKWGNLLFSEDKSLDDLVHPIIKKGEENCFSLALMCVDYLKTGEEEIFLNKQKYNIIHSEAFNNVEDYLIADFYFRNKYPSEIINLTRIISREDVYGKDLKIDELKQKAEFSQEKVMSILKELKPGDTGYLDYMSADEITSDFKIETKSDPHAMAFFIYLNEAGEKTVRLLDLQMTSGNYLDLTPEKYLEWIHEKIPNKLFFFRDILVIKKG